MKNNENKQVLLNARPHGMAKISDFTIATTPLPDLDEGQFLVKIDYISLDPALRGWMNEGTTYIAGVAIGAVMRTFSAGHVVESKHEGFKIGDTVTGLFGAQTYAISNGQGVDKVNAEKTPLSWHLGVLGMPGMTAYFGLLERGKPQAGDTVFVSGAAGMVGALVGQIAKIKGCRVVGSAGGAEKCRYLTEILGFDAAIDYKNDNLVEALKAACPSGIDVFFDNVGGETLDAGLANLARGARVVICGAISQYNNASIEGPKNYMKIVSARGTLTGIIVFDFIKDYPKAVADITNWLNEGKIHYREHVEHGIERFPEVLQMLFTSDNFGKLILKI
jgi:NADPH-dependent curcumin reductase